MKITVNLEIEPSEIGLATELLATLRLLTAHAANGGAPGGAGASPAAAAAAVVVPVVQNVPQLMRGLLDELAADVGTMDSVATRVNTILSDASYGARSQNVTNLKEAFQTHVLTEAAAQQGRSAAPCIQLLTKLPDDVKGDITKDLISFVLRHLALKRDVEVDRAQFAAHAEAFAAFVAMEAVAVDGAVQSIFRLMKKRDTRSAALVMFGNVVQLCRERLSACAPQHLEALYKELDTVSEKTFEYDVSWINSSLNRTPAGAPAGAPAPASAPAPAPAGAPPQAAAAAAPAAAAPAISEKSAAAAQFAQEQAQAAAGPVAYGLHVASIYPGTEQAVFSLSYNATTNQIIGGGKDPYLTAWDASTGAVTAQVPVETAFVCGTALTKRSGTLLVCGTQSDPNGNAVACIAGYSGPSLNRLGVLTPASTISVNALTSLGPADDCFVASQSMDGSEVVALYDLAGGQAFNQMPSCRQPEQRKGGEGGALYDLAGGQAFNQMTPIRTWNDHRDMISCLCTHPTDANVFVSGARDKTIRVWDRRMAECAGVFGRQDPSTFEVSAHSDMVTTLDSFGHALLSASVDTTLCYWDFRQMGRGGATAEVARMALDQHPILKLAASGCPYPNVVAISTWGGLYVVDLTDVQSPQPYAASLHVDEKRPQSFYHELRWATDSPYLFAANENPGVDVLKLTVHPRQLV
ncbi:hypothetical protein FOA52_002104 [Chlamydomonas sp. UWO 241]|nr:hypothetical protein FOA52_002104 [Chlamydomonas sp. UWO 241]